MTSVSFLNGVEEARKGMLVLNSCMTAEPSLQFLGLCNIAPVCRFSDCASVFS